MNTRQLLSVALALALGASVLSCQPMDSETTMPTGPAALSVEYGRPSTPPDAMPKFKGPAVPVGRGMAQTWATLDPAGAPLAVGVTLSEGTLVNLPAETASWVLRFHPKAAAAPFTHVLLDYNPQGHEPPGIYDLPHFDVHFYTVPVEERLLIQPNDPGFAVDPLPQYIPAAYMKVPGGVPQMGSHWVDLLSPEFNGGAFTQTYIWGTFDGEVTFFEPMVAKAYLESEPHQTLALRQPQAYQRDGYYPMSYRIEKLENPARYEIALEDLTFRPGQ